MATWSIRPRSSRSIRKRDTPARRTWAPMSRMRARPWARPSTSRRPSAGSAGWSKEASSASRGRTADRSRSCCLRARGWTRNRERSKGRWGMPAWGSAWPDLGLDPLRHRDSGQVEAVGVLDADLPPRALEDAPADDEVAAALDGELALRAAEVQGRLLRAGHEAQVEELHVMVRLGAALAVE